MHSSRTEEPGPNEAVTDVVGPGVSRMSEPPGKSNRLPELPALVGAPDEIEPVNHVFARKVGQVIARASANLQERYGWRRRREGQPQATSRK
jgi:hypothetical protein